MHIQKCHTNLVDGLYGTSLYYVQMELLLSMWSQRVKAYSATSARGLSPRSPLSRLLNVM